MAKENVAVVAPGQKMRHKRNNTVYIVRDVYDEDVLLTTENGENSMRIQLAALASAGFELVSD